MSLSNDPEIRIPYGFTHIDSTHDVLRVFGQRVQGFWNAMASIVTVPMAPTATKSKFWSSGGHCGTEDIFLQRSRVHLRAGQLGPRHLRVRHPSQLLRIAMGRPARLWRSGLPGEHHHHPEWRRHSRGSHFCSFDLTEFEWYQPYFGLTRRLLSNHFLRFSLFAGFKRSQSWEIWKKPF